MKGKKLLAGVLSATMVLGTMSIPVFADEPATINSQTQQMALDAFEVFVQWDKYGTKPAHDGITFQLNNVGTIEKSITVKLYSKGKLVSTTNGRGDEVIGYTDTGDGISGTIVYDGSDPDNFSGSWSTKIESAWTNKVPDTMEVTIDDNAPVTFKTSEAKTYYEYGYNNFKNLVTVVSTEAELNEAMKSSNSIYLNNDITMNGQLKVSCDLNLGGHNITLPSGRTDSALIEGNIKISNGTIIVPDKYYAGDAIIMLNSQSKAGNTVEFEKLNFTAQGYTAGCGLIGINSDSTLKMTGGEINITGETVDTGNNCDSIFDGNIGSGNNWGKLILDGTKITTVSTHQLFAGLYDVEISNVNFEGVLREFLFARVSGSVEDSSFTYKNKADESIRSVLRVDKKDNLSFTNTKVIDIPTNFANKKDEENNTQVAFLGKNKTGKVFMDDKTSEYFAEEAVNKILAAEGFYNNNGKIEESKATIKNTETTSTGANITLDDLRFDSAIENTEDTTYKVTVSEVPADDLNAVNTVLATGETNIFAYDIKVIKENKNGTTEEVAVQNRTVTITLPEPIPEGAKLYHVTDTGAVEVTYTTSNGGKTITFTAPSFSTYFITAPASTSTTDNSTDKVTVDFVPTSNANEYDIVLKADDTKTINGFKTADLKFALTQGTSGRVTYEIKAAQNINLLNNAADEYTFHMAGENTLTTGITSPLITIGKVTFDGYCEGASFKIDTTAGNTKNRVNATKFGTNDAKVYADPASELDLTKTIDNITIEEAKETLIINIAFPNPINGNAKEFQDMHIDITSAKSTKTIDLADALTDNKYVVTEELVKGDRYTVKVYGAGYRTATYTFTLNDSTTLNFWNDVATTETEVEVGEANSKKKTTFLAGELVKDGQINIYDLSAVVSYFGESTADTSSAWNYTKYDLDRNGVIDSQDIAYVLYSLLLD